MLTCKLYWCRYTQKSRTFEILLKSPSTVRLKISEDGTSLLYGGTENVMNAKKGFQFNIMSQRNESYLTK